MAGSGGLYNRVFVAGSGGLCNRVFVAGTGGLYNRVFVTGCLAGLVSGMGVHRGDSEGSSNIF